MTSSLTPAADAAPSPACLTIDPFVGLDLTDATWIAAAMSAAHAESTRAVYAQAWRTWERWCATRSITPMPAAPAAICAYLTQPAEQGASAGTLDGACSRSPATRTYGTYKGRRVLLKASLSPTAS